MRSANARQWRWMALLMALALVLAACGGDDDGEGDDAAGEDGDAEVDDGDGDDGEAAEGGTYAMYLCEPQRLLPQTSTEVCGSQVLEALFTGLVAYDPETAEPVEGGMATSIESDDQQNWTITIEEGWTFHNGEPVTAQSYVDAWNWMADPSNEMDNAQFLATAGFEGYEEVAAGEADEMSGVEAVDDTTIEVSLVEPFGPFELLIGYTGFYPLPEEFYEMEPEEFESAPIGNGPYQIDGEWRRGEGIDLARYEDYGGEPANAERVEMRIYADANTAYLDFQAGELDIHDGVPPEQRSAAMDEFGDRFFDNETSSYDYLGFPTHIEPFDDPDLRRAISLAIDRESIIDVIFDGARTPATSALPPTLPAHREDACEYCEHDPERAQELFEQAGGYDGTLNLYFNSGVGHEEWMESVSLQLEQTLGITDIQFESLEFAEYLDLLDAGEVDGPFRLGWVTVYPSPQYSMELYRADSPSNYTGFEDPEFNELMDEANASPPEEADPIYQQAEDILLDEMVIAPLWYGLDSVVHSERVDNVIADNRTFIRIADVEVVDQ